MMQASKPVLIVAAGLLLASCQNHALINNDAPLNAGFGDSIQHNAAVMIVDPNPAMAADVDVPLNGARANSAIRRYESGGVIAPTAESTGGVQ